MFSLLYHQFCNCFIAAVARVPEIGDDLPEKNPLLKEDGFPEFNRLTIEKCVATIGKQAIEFEQGVRRIEDSIQSENKPMNFNPALVFRCFITNVCIHFFNRN